MNKKGFTLIELLAAIIIIAIIMTLILPSALRVNRKNQKKIYGEYENMMVEYAKVSVLNDQDIIDLIDLEELEQVKNECSGYVEIDHTSNPPKYYPYITCGDKYTTANYNVSYAKTIIPIPVCKSNLIYNGSVQTLVESNLNYTMTNATRKDVGKQNVTLSLNDTNEYVWSDSTFENKTLVDCEIQKRNITLSAESKMMNYGDSVPTNSYILTNGINGENPFSDTVSYTYKDADNNSASISSSTPVGVYSIVPSATITSNYSLTIEDGVLIIMRNTNPITVNASQSWSTAYSVSAQEKEFTGATGAQGTLSYSIKSQTKGNTSVNYFTIPTGTTNKIRMAANTPVGNYIVVINATAAGTDNYLEGTLEITLNVTVTAIECNAPTNIQIGTNGKVSWTASSNCSNATYEVKVANGSYTSATSPANKLNDIIAATGSRSVCVKAVAYNSNYVSNEACTSTNVYSVSLTKGTGVSAVSGAGNYISGATVTLGATVSAGYKWSKWTQTSGGAQVSTTNAYQATITSNLAYTANTTVNSYTVSYIDNIFAAQSQSTDGVTVTYTENGSYLTLNGTFNSTSMNFWNLDRRTINSGDVFKITVKHISGSLTCADKSDCTGSKGRPVLVLDLTVDGNKFSDRMTSPYSCTTMNLPTSAQNENTYTVPASRASANGLQFWMYQATASNATFSNYKVQILITKVHSKSVDYNSTYGTLDTPYKQGFDFNGWYTAADGTTQVTSSTKLTSTSNQEIYAKYTSHKLNLQYNGNGSDVTWCSTSTIYSMDSSKYAIITSGSNRNTQTIPFGQFISYSSGLNNYNNSSYFCFSKSGYTAVPSSEWVLNGNSSKVYGQDNKSYTAIAIANDAGCNLSNTSTCTAQVNVNWKSANPIAVTATQSWSPTFSTSSQDKAFTAATSAQGAVTYSIQSQKKGSTTVSSFSIPTSSTATLRMAASTGAGTYTVVIRSSAAGNNNYIAGYKDITMTVTVAKATNPIAATTSQSWSPTFSTSSQDKAFTAATSAQGAVTYSIQSQKKGSTTVSSFSIPTSSTATLRMAASTGAGTYTVVIRASAAGNDNYSSGYKDITMTVTVGRAGVAFPTCTSVYYNGSSQTLFAAHTSGTYTNSAISGTNAGTYKGNLTPTANYQWSSGSNVTSARELSCVINASEAVNTVNGVTTGYATLAAALTASTTGTTKLISNCNSAIDLPSGYNKTLDLNGKTLKSVSNHGTMTLKNGTVQMGGGWAVANYATMTMNGVTVNYTSTDTGCAVVNSKVTVDATMTLTNVTITSNSSSLDNDGGTMTATNVTITKDGDGVEVWNKNGGKLTFIGGSVAAGAFCAHDNCAESNESIAKPADLLVVVNTTTNNAKGFGRIIHIKTITSGGKPYVMTGLLNSTNSSDKFECPTWTTANGQDDLKWHTEDTSVSAGFTVSKSKKYCYFARSTHNNETGTYSTHFYANDKFITGTNWTWN